MSLAGRPPSAAPALDRLPHLDGWRGLAILLVCAGHFIPPLLFLANVGVELFFALSGRLMADLLIGKRQPIGEFLWRRLARIGPGLLVYVACSTLLLLAAGWLHGERVPWLSPVAALLLFHNYLPQAETSPILEHCWSLAVEEHGYLLLVAIVVLAGRRRRLAAYGALLVAGMGFLNGFRLEGAWDAAVQYPLWRSDVRVASILLPFALRLLWAGGGLARWPVLGAFAPALCVGAVFVHMLPLPHAVGLILGSALAAFAVNTLDAAPGAWRALLSHRWLMGAGVLSFSLYLWQQLFYVMVHHGGSPFLAVSLLIVTALLSHRCVEAPARAWLIAKGGAGRSKPIRPAGTVSPPARDALTQTPSPTAP